MLQRAASNAYSWWWASHIRTKQSKWLEQNLQDMEEKVSSMLQIIDDEGDSFAQRAEMYYKKRPELVSIVEDTYRAYRALAERYDHLSKDLQSANRTIASVFPEQVPFDMDEEDEENVSHRSTSTSPRHDEPGAVKPSTPKVPFPKRQLKIASSSAKAAASESSGLDKNEALVEIDKLHKEILELQTEMEFVKSSYEQGYEKFCEIENQITEKQKRICSLQDEFGIEAVIDDNEARTLMASRALKSCQEALSKLKVKHERSTEEARVESKRIKHVNKKFEALRNMFDSHQPNQQEMHKSVSEIDDMLFEIDSVEKERQDLEKLQKEIEEQLELSSNAFLTMSQLAERIDDLVQRVINLEIAVFSENALVQRLRTDADKLQAQVKSLEEDREALIEGSDTMKNRMNELEGELSRVIDLVKTLVEQNNSFKAHFTEASCNVNHLSVKLHTVKMDEDVENTGFSEANTGSDGKADMGIEEHENEFTHDHSSVLKGIRFEMEGKDKSIPHGGESYVNSESSSKFDVDSRKGLESMEEDKSEKKYFSETASSVPDTEIEELGTDEDEEHPNWRQLYLSGLDDREKILLDEYSSVLQNYKDVRKKLNDVEKRNREGFFELALQIRELKNAVASRDGEIQSLRQKGGFEDENKSVELESTVTESIQTSPISVVQRKAESNEKVVEAAAQERYKDSPKNMVGNLMLVKPGSTPRAVLSVEEKIRSAIDDILEENLEFWLRFSTSFHQIRKYQTSVQDLKAELSTLREKRKHEGSGSSKHRQSLKSEARPIYAHFREIKTELTLWLENNAVLKDEVQGRYSALCNIQDEIATVTNVSGLAGDTELSGYQAAKFQGEVLNMKQENNKVAEELKAGFERVRQLNVEVEKIMADLEKELMPLSSPRTPQARKKGPRIPLRSFLFGIKLKNKRTKGASMFACGHPMLQKQYSFIAEAEPPEQPPQ